MLYPFNFSPRVRRRGGVLPDKRDRFTCNKYFYIDLCAVLTFLIPRRRLEALVSILTLFYDSGDIGAVTVLSSTKLADNVLTYLLHARANFRAQVRACRATVAQTLSPRKHWTLGAAYRWRFRSSFQLFRLHFLSYNSPISRFCPSSGASYGEWATTVTFRGLRVMTRRETPQTPAKRRQPTRLKWRRTPDTSPHRRARGATRDARFDATRRAMDARWVV